jgi:hypothetical protein
MRTRNSTALISGFSQLSISGFSQLSSPVARQAAPPGTTIEHGTAPGRSDFLLRSEHTDQEMGRLKPDILVLTGDTVTAVIDAKYKRLHNTRERPNGVDQADLYQLVSYALRFKPTLLSALAYPLDPDRTADDLSSAERHNPWYSDQHRFEFQRLPTDIEGCRTALSTLLADHPAPSLYRAAA